MRNPSVKEFSEIIQACVKKLVSKERLSRLKHRLVEGTFYALSVCLALSLIRQFVHIQVIVFFLIPLAGIILSISLALAFPIDRKKLLIRVDRELDLKERLSTAYEYLKEKNRGIMTDLLIEDAALHTEKIDFKKLYPKSLPPRLKYLPLLLAGIIFFSTIGLNLPFGKRGRPDSEIIDPGQRIESFSRKQAARAREKELDDSMRLYEQMRRLGRELQTGEVNESDAARRLEEMADKLQQRIDSLEYPHISRLESDPDFEKAPDIKDLLDEAAHGDLTDAELEVIRDALNSQHLSEVIRDLAAEHGPEKDSSDEEKDFLQGLLSDLDILKEMDDLSKAGRMLLDSAASLGSHDMRGGGGGQEDRPGEDFPEDMASSGTGTQAVEDQSDSSKLSLKDYGQDFSRIESRPGGNYKQRILLRSLSPGGESVVSREEILLDYQKQAEEVIRKEEIPNNFREYIKNYFLKIGLVEE